MRIPFFPVPTKVLGYFTFGADLCVIVVICLNTNKKILKKEMFKKFKVFENCRFHSVNLQNGTSFGKSQLLHGVILANQNKNKKARKFKY